MGRHTPVPPCGAGIVFFNKGLRNFLVRKYTIFQSLPIPLHGPFLQMRLPFKRFTTIMLIYRKKSIRLSLAPLLLAVAALLLPAQALAQIDSLVFCGEQPEVSPAQKDELRFALDLLAFVRDNEYNHKELIKGYTLPGITLAPSFSYQPLKNLKLEVGVHMIHFWGANNYPNANYTNLDAITAQSTTRAFHVTPTFRANLQLTPQVNVVLGTLYGKSMHGLVQPLYNDEVNLTGDPETGVQLLWKNHWLSLDMWVDWQKFIFKHDKGQERFAYGLSSRFFPSPRTARVQWYVPVQMVMQHIGGEINTEAEDRTIKTWLNAAAGAGVNIPLRTKVPVSVNVEATANYYSQQSGTVLPFQHGMGLWAKAGVKVWRFGATVGWWQSHKFIPILGSTLFSSMSTSQDGVTFDNPRMLFLRAEYAHTLGKGFSWGVHADYGYHAQSGTWYDNGTAYRSGGHAQNFAAGIYLRAIPSFLIKKFRKD